MYSSKIHQIELPGLVDSNIKYNLNNYDYWIPKDFDWSYMTKAGRITTRLLKLYKKYCNNNEQRMKSFQDSLSIFSSLYIISPQIHSFDITQQDWDAGDFGDSGSCYWEERAPARELIRDDGGGAIRFYKNGKGIARAWIMPKDDGYIIFNGYGYTSDLISKIFGSWKQLPVKPISLYNNQRTASLIYINDDAYGVNLKDDAYDLEIDTSSCSKCNNCDYYYHVAEGPNCDCF